MVPMPKQQASLIGVLGPGWCWCAMCTLELGFVLTGCRSGAAVVAPVRGAVPSSRAASARRRACGGRLRALQLVMLWRLGGPNALFRLQVPKI